ncbi:DUF1569 domain-containing protein [Chitinophaga nivalis]|uniref:DUF1569 domain-containing protein n=1 Tax=Chitinophaga nivalis TaxID=2991709 RepID=A0ABT3ITF9_9BACT|nr:DUF1569 domain-containing protein [Chitinophaga nivalis]MCW3463326.1 DUF1569 domain-containing protein [Chitinophaga nivalis]MCW3486984.1 DUF1569 domain-containing protein [Chitinophaga nivalis]
MMATDFLTAPQLTVYLERLHEDTPAVWGKMNAIQMLEHLGAALQASCNTKGPQEVVTPPEKIDQYKAFLHNDQEIRRHTPSPLQGEIPPPPRAADIATAADRLLEEVNNFHTYFQQLPERQTVHHIFGLLDYNEWLLFHKKHIEHHFRQFAVL